MSLFAAIVLTPGGVAAWLVVGVCCAWLAGKMLDEASYGVSGDLIAGAGGGLAGGAAFGLFVSGAPSFWASVLVALIGAGIVLAVARIVAARGSA